MWAILPIREWRCQDTQDMFIGVPQLLRRLPTVPVSMLGIEITPVAVAKDLGIYIDQSMERQNCLMVLVSIILGGYVIIFSSYVIIFGD